MDLINVLLTNPVTQGMIAKVVISTLQTLFQKVDADKSVDQVQPWLQPTLAVLAFIVTCGTLAMKHELASAPVQVALDWVFMMVAANGTGTKTITNAVSKVIDTVKK